MATQSNIQILEAILKRDLQSEQTEEINNLKKLNSYCPKDPDRIFLLDEDEFPNMIGYISPENIIGYISPENMDREDIKETIKEATLIWNLFGVKIYKIN